MPINKALRKASRLAIESKLIIIEGCAARIADEPRNTPEARSKGRIIGAEAAALRDMIREALMDPELRDKVVE